MQTIMEDEIDVSKEECANKTILEIGSGRGDTTRKIVKQLAEIPSSKLIVTDISDTFFHDLKTEFERSGVNIQYILTRAEELKRIESSSVDYIICSYTLCAINAEHGNIVLALRRFYNVLKPGGKLFVEGEEFPIYMCSAPSQEIWVDKWRLLKAGMLLTNQLPYNEIAPKKLLQIGEIVGFSHIRWTRHTSSYPATEALDFVRRRLSSIIPALPNDELREGFIHMMNVVERKMKTINEMEAPFYKMAATKPVG
jgi:SAM-dependent methyltransferase